MANLADISQPQVPLNEQKDLYKLIFPINFQIKKVYFSHYSLQF